MDKKNYIQIAESKDDVRQVLESIKKGFLLEYPKQLLRRGMNVQVQYGDRRYGCLVEPAELPEARCAQIAHIVDLAGAEIQKETLLYPLSIDLCIQVTPQEALL